MYSNIIANKYIPSPRSPLHFIPLSDPFCTLLGGKLTQQSVQQKWDAHTDAQIGAK